MSSVLSRTSIAADHRVTSGLQVLYDFAGGTEGVVSDRADVGAAIDLKITDTNAVRRVDGGLKILKPTIIQTDQPPARLISAVRRSGEISVEAWVQPRDTKQDGPARVVTISKDSSNRNFTFGQDGDRFEVRLRTTKTSRNGVPSLLSPVRTAKTNLTHVTYTHAKNGETRIYVNGKQTAEKRIGGNASGWDESYRLGLVNELSKDRPWLGTLHLVAIYSRSLNANEVTQNFDAGPDGQPSEELIAERRQRAAAKHFEMVVAPLFAKHCLECHDSATHESGLDLSKKVTAFRGGENGKVILPGKSAGSPLWASVESGSMPHERLPLSVAENTALKKWIDEGATWTLDQIDPAIYAHGSENQNFVRRLTVDEYIATVREAVDVDIEKEAREILPRDLRADGFSNTAYNLGVDFQHVNAYAALAEIIVSRMDVKRFVQKYSKRQKFTDKDMGEAISKVGRWLLRGPIDERDVIAYRGITTTVASAGGTFEEAMSYVIEAMLQSPRFIYRVESQRGDGTSLPVSDYELASRMSYIIWGAPPDEELMKAAESGQLAAWDAEKHAIRMLQDPRAVRQSLRFATDWLNLGRLDNLRPDAERFPDWDPQLAADMRQETLAYFEEVVWKQEQPLSALLNAQVTFATPRLAKFYGLEGQGSEVQRYDLSKVAGRGGLLTQGSLLTVGGDNASMVTRGLLVMQELLRGVVNDPPPGIDTTPTPTRAGLTQRGIAMQRISNASCGGCHSRFEPLAFALEKFDGVGAYHDTDEHGNKLRGDGEILFPGTAKAVQFADSAELMDLLANSDRVSQTLTWKVAQFAVGRPLVAEDAAIVDNIHKAASANGGTWSALITAIVASDLVQTTKTEAAAE
ncbi:MAG: DUF1592 domain-containing protein [Fuerstiella sp.]|nr:DUF1592 domain-containing protein [Fuerstiella sp.]MCP4856011.1 DUF1592 domain-containing protein [Fuerstiella sp.]